MIKRYIAGGLALLCLSANALAQEAVVAPTSVSGLLNLLYGALATLITVGLIPLAIMWFRQMTADRELRLAETKSALKKIEEQSRAAVEGGAQNALGGALGQENIPKGGKLPTEMRERVVAAASATLAKNFPDSLGDLGVTNIAAKATEIIEARVGRMEAQAAGTPIPNSSAAAPAPAASPVKG